MPEGHANARNKWPGQEAVGQRLRIIYPGIGNFVSRKAGRLWLWIRGGPER